MPNINRGDRLVHYTKSAETIASILRNGFLLIPNKRYLINALLGAPVFSDREPQEFGMVSFTQLPFDSARAHRENFGNFGIAVSWEWAAVNDAQRVIYVDQRGPLAETFAWLFRLAKQELDRVTAGKPSAETLTNKAVASSAASTLYAKLLTLYEYMEPERNSAHVEWRIVNKLPQHHDQKERSELIRELLAAAKLWRGLGSIKVEPNDIHAFICPAEEEANLRSVLPAEFSDIPIRVFRSRPRITRLARALERASWSHRSRERLIVVEKVPPADVIWLRLNRNGAYHLPEAGRVWGAMLYQDELIEGIHCNIQYQSKTGFLCELVLPILDALYLLNLLKLMQHDAGLDSLNPSDSRGR